MLIPKRGVRKEISLSLSLSLPLFLTLTLSLSLPFSFQRGREKGRHGNDDQNWNSFLIQDHRVCGMFSLMMKKEKAKNGNGEREGERRKK